MHLARACICAVVCLPAHDAEVLAADLMLLPCAVLSRLAVLWGIVHVAPPAQVHWAFALMAISWSLVEVPRYVFYLWKLVSNSVPYWLLWVRYSLFIVLYPTGITGACRRPPLCVSACFHVCFHHVIISVLTLRCGVQVKWAVC